MHRQTARLALLVIAVLQTACSDVVLPLYPSSAKHVVFRNGEVQLSGILVRPKTPPPYPAVILVHGSGPWTVDEPSWKIHARAFAHSGFAVLVYNKRGAGESGGTLATADYDTLAGDVVAAIKFLRTIRDIDPQRIGLLGHSEGGWVAPLAANQVGDVAFIITSAGPAVSPHRQMMYELRTRLSKEGVGDAEVARILKQRDQVWARRAMLDYDPRSTLVALRSPLLAVFAERDVVVDTRESVAILEEIRKAYGKPFQIEVIPDVPHSMRQPHRVPARYPRRYLQLITEWAAEQVHCSICRTSHSNSMPGQ